MPLDGGDAEEGVALRRVEGDPAARELRVSCPDATGLGADVCRTLMDFGLQVVKADIQTDGVWAYLVLNAALGPGAPPRWALLKQRLEAVLPREGDALRRLRRGDSLPKERPAFVLAVEGAAAGRGFLHRLVQALWDAELQVLRARATTTPAGDAADAFWVVDTREDGALPDPDRAAEVVDRVRGALGAAVRCSLRPASAEARGSGSGCGGGGGGADAASDAAALLTPPALHRRSGSSLCRDAASSTTLRSLAARARTGSAAAPSLAASDAFDAAAGSPSPSPSLSPSPLRGASPLPAGPRPRAPADLPAAASAGAGPSAFAAAAAAAGWAAASDAASDEEEALTPASSAAAARAGLELEVDASASGAHTAVALRCRDRKGLLFDLFCALKAVGLRVSFGRLDVDAAGVVHADLFVQDAAEGGRVAEPGALAALAARLRRAAALPLRVEVRDAPAGGATELTVAAGLDAGGRGRPRVVFDCTGALAAAGVDVEAADVYVEEPARCVSVGGGSGGAGSDGDDAGGSGGGRERAREVHRFLVHAPQGGALRGEREKRALLDAVTARLMGTWTASASAAGGGEAGALARGGAGAAAAAAADPLARAISARWKGL
jgi:hypothetical protein